MYYTQRFFLNRTADPAVLPQLNANYILATQIGIACGPITTSALGTLFTAVCRSDTLAGSSPEYPGMVVCSVVLFYGAAYFPRYGEVRIAPKVHCSLFSWRYIWQMVSEQPAAPLLFLGSLSAVSFSAYTARCSRRSLHRLLHHRHREFITK